MPRPNCRARAPSSGISSRLIDGARRARKSVFGEVKIRGLGGQENPLFRRPEKPGGLTARKIHRFGGLKTRHPVRCICVKAAGVVLRLFVCRRILSGGAVPGFAIRGTGCLRRRGFVRLFPLAGRCELRDAGFTCSGLLPLVAVQPLLGRHFLLFGESPVKGGRAAEAGEQG